MYSQNVVDVFESITKDEKTLKTLIKPQVESIVKKELYFKIPIFRIAYKAHFDKEVKKALIMELVMQLHMSVFEIMEALDTDIVNEYIKAFYYKIEDYQ